MAFVPSLTQIAPRRIHGNNQLKFLDPKPALDLLLAVDCVAYVVETFVVNEPVDLVPLAKLRPDSGLVSPNSAAEIICDSNVKRLGAIG
jgi:hypothetical protein